MKRAFSFCVTMLLGACGAAPIAAPPARHEAPSSPPIELSLRTANGGFVDVGDLRGAPTLIIIFATYDTLCQAAAESVSRFYREHRDVHVIGIAAQPDPRELLEPYAAALHLPYTLTYEPDDKLLHSNTDLGTIDQIPSFFMLDSNGVIRERATGYVSERALDNMLDRITGGTTPARASDEDDLRPGAQH